MRNNALSLEVFYVALLIICHVCVSHANVLFIGDHLCLYIFVCVHVFVGLSAYVCVDA